MKRKVLFFSPVPDFKGGAERSLFDLMGNPQIEPRLVVPELGPVSIAAERKGVPVEVVPFGGVASIRRPLTAHAVVAAGADWVAAARRLNEICRRDSIDIVHSNGLKAHCVAGLARRMGGRPTVFHVRDIAVHSSERAIWRGLTQLCDHMVVVSRACWPSKTLSANVSIVHNGIEPPAQPNASWVNATDGIITLGFCGRIHPFKGLDVLIDWLAFAHSKGTEARLVVRGEAAPEDAEYLAGIHRKIEALGLQEWVRFDGRVEGIKAVYTGLDAVAVPSIVPDPLPRSVMEAMSLGCSVIGYPAGGIPDMIEDGKNGWLASDAADFLKALINIGQGGEALEMVRLAAWQTINEKFILSIMYDKINTIYDGMARRHG